MLGEGECRLLVVGPHVKRSPPGVAGQAGFLQRDAVRKTGEGGDQLGHALGADEVAHRRAARLRELPVIGGAEADRLVDRGRQPGVVPRRQRASKRLVGEVANHLREVLEHGPGGPLEQRERRLEHPALEGGITGLP